MNLGIIEKYRSRLPVSEKTPVVTLLEGETPLVPAPRLSKTIGLGETFELYLKLEGTNPTGSFKDRGMTLAISKATEERAKAVVCASTGNTAASAAAYAARAGIPCYVFLPHGSVALGKLTQALMHGANILSLKGDFDQALSIVKEISIKHEWTIVNSLNPYRIEGQKTAAFEIVEALDKPPDYQFMPVGNAGNITAYWKGYKELSTSPRMMGFQAKDRRRTIATAIRIRNPVSWQGALQACNESGGDLGTVTDKEILHAYTLVAKTEGIFCEPSSAAGIAGLIQLVRSGYFKDSQLKIVCILTGHGLKDPSQPLKVCPKFKVVAPHIKDIEKAIK